MSKEIIKQHLNNILYGLKKSNLTWEEQEVVKASFDNIYTVLIGIQEANTNENKTANE
jgi:hypothetical protein